MPLGRDICVVSCNTVLDGPSAQLEREICGGEPDFLTQNFIRPKMLYNGNAQQ